MGEWPKSTITNVAAFAAVRSTNASVKIVVSDLIQDRDAPQ